MALRSDGMRTEKRILTTCVRLFLENGYHATTLQQISKESGVSIGSFFNLFHSKDGVLQELVRFMFENQFSMARHTIGAELPPVYIYAVETSIQLTLTELNENLRDIYLEAYTCRETLDYIQASMAKELQRIFGAYQPQLTEIDFLALDYCSSGIMRGCMATPCSETFSLEKKLRAFLSAVLRVYRVPEEEEERVLTFVLELNIRAIAQQVMETLFRAMAMRYDFSLGSLLPQENTAAAPSPAHEPAES